jgi:LPS O-antigen subunit length determinant protein (WzzB/FepE family)
MQKYSNMKIRQNIKSRLQKVKEESIAKIKNQDKVGDSKNQSKLSKLVSNTMNSDKSGWKELNQGSSDTLVKPMVQSNAQVRYSVGGNKTGYSKLANLNFKRRRVDGEVNSGAIVAGDKSKIILDF